MTMKLPGYWTISAGEFEIISIDGTDWLDDGELFDSGETVSFTELTTANLTLANKAVNAAEYVDSHTGRTVAIGKGLQCSVTTTTPGTYEIEFSATTTNSIPRVVKKKFELRVE